MKKKLFCALIALLCFALSACAAAQESTTASTAAEQTHQSTAASTTAQKTTAAQTTAVRTTASLHTTATICFPWLERDTADYSILSLPDYKAQNPVRYLSYDDPMGEYNGWQNFGSQGELCTHPLPRTSYNYQLYSYYIRNDISHLFSPFGVELPQDLCDIAVLFRNTDKYGCRALWYSFGLLPEEVIGGSVNAIYVGDQKFLRAAYTVDGKEFLLYIFRDESEKINVFAVRINDQSDIVSSFTDSLIASYKAISNE